MVRDKEVQVQPTGFRPTGLTDEQVASKPRFDEPRDQAESLRERMAAAYVQDHEIDADDEHEKFLERRWFDYLEMPRAYIERQLPGGGRVDIERRQMIENGQRRFRYAGWLWCDALGMYCLFLAADTLDQFQRDALAMIERAKARKAFEAAWKKERGD